MSLTSIASEIKNSVEQAQAWIAKAVEEHAPALLAEAERIQASPVYQALEGVVLPADVEQEIARIIAAFVKLVPQAPVPEVPAAPEQPAEAPELPAEDAAAHELPTESAQPGA